MRAIFNTSTDPYFNIASDEYILRYSKDDVFMIWRNAPAVIIGKNQNAWAEVNIPFVTKENIPVVRRVTGGGAVFHDLGNVNFSFVTRADDRTKLNFEKFTAPIIAALRDVGVEASLDGRNDITACGYKISGNAECVMKNIYGEDMILHHGTLLFSLSVNDLSSALNVSPLKLKSRGIKSVSSRVKNISELDGYSGPRDVGDFMTLIMDRVSGAERTPFAPDEISVIEKLKREKFSTWEWNYGASPSFEGETAGRFDFGTVQAMFTCRAGAIEKIRFYGDFFGDGDTSSLEAALTGVKFDAPSLSAALEGRASLVESCIAGASPRDIVALLTDTTQEERE
ncbi:MAG: lipoate--protein ligase [Clostridia bacterium]|nr:lipoate--protein ligase [Clostridia bacterium]